MPIRVCVAGVTGWTGSLVAKSILNSKEFKLTGAIARKASGKDVGEALGLDKTGVTIVETLDEASVARRRPC